MDNKSILTFAEARGWNLQKWNVILEGKSDVDILQQAVEQEMQVSGKNYSDNFAFLASGDKDDGGVDGVWRTLSFFHTLSRDFLDYKVKRQYRFIGVLDNDPAARRDFKSLCRVHQLCECREIFFMYPYMPSSGILDPTTLKTSIGKLNSKYTKIDWEIEDYFNHSFWNAFLADHPEALKSKGKYTADDMTHYELTNDGKAEFHRYIKLNAIHEDFFNIINFIKSLRFFMNAPRL